MGRSDGKSNEGSEKVKKMNDEQHILVQQR